MASHSDHPRRGLFWVAVLVALAVIVTGGVVALVGYNATSGPKGTVLGYFAALRRDDATAALGFGDLPSGSRELLTAKVLREQQRIAAMSEVAVTRTVRTGNTAQVDVKYVLDFGGTRLDVTDSLSVHQHDGGWRLDESAAPTRLLLTGATNRATVLGAPLMTDTVLVFPGAAPIRFDTPNLQLDPGSAIVHMDHSGNTTIGVVPSAVGKAAADAAVTAAVTACLRGTSTSDPRCPLPASRAVPDSLRATPPANIAHSLVVSVTGDDDGMFLVSGKITVTGKYSLLDFNNIPHTVTGRFPLALYAMTYSQPPVEATWQLVQSS